MKIQFTFVDGNTADQFIIPDATLKESYSLAADITEYPVEEGSDINDNIRAKPDQLTVDWIIADKPLKTSGQSAAPGGASPGEQKPANAETRSQNAFKQLDQLRTQGVSLQVTAGLKSYDNMGIALISVDRDKETPTSTDKRPAGGIKLQIQLKQLTIVKGQTVAIQNAKEPAGKTKTEKGKQTPQDATDADTKTQGAKALDAVKEQGKAAIDLIKGTFF